MQLSTSKPQAWKEWLWSSGRNLQRSLRPRGRDDEILSPHGRQASALVHKFWQVLPWLHVCTGAASREIATSTVENRAVSSLLILCVRKSGHGPYYSCTRNPGPEAWKIAEAPATCVRPPARPPLPAHPATANFLAGGLASTICCRKLAAPSGKLETQTQSRSFGPSPCKSAAVKISGKPDKYGSYMILHLGTLLGP